MLTKRTIWILNFSTTAILFLVFLGFALNRIILEPNDKDIIVIPFTLIIVIYMTLISFLFYKKIIKWNKDKSRTFYWAILPNTVLSLFLLVNLGRSVIDYSEEFSLLDILAVIICGVNIVTFCSGLIIKRD